MERRDVDIPPSPRAAVSCVDRRFSRHDIEVYVAWLARDAALSRLTVAIEFCEVADCDVRVSVDNLRVFACGISDD